MSRILSSRDNVWTSDNTSVKDMADKYRTIQANADKACHVQQR